MSIALHKIISQIEQLYRQGEYAGSPDALFRLIEDCVELRPDESVVALIHYRAEV